MNTGRNTLLLSFLSLFLLVAVGCADDVAPTGASGDDISGTNGMEEIDLDQPYGGLEYSDETEAFGDAELLSEAARVEDLSAEIAEEDSLSDDDPGLRDAQVRRTYVRILWGQLDGRPEDSVVAATMPDRLLDWTGAVSVSEGAVALSRLIRFERPFDHRLPRDDRQSLGWVSHTGPHFDGILICVLSRPDDNGDISGELTFRTGPFTQGFRIADLAGLDEVHRVDDQGNAVSFIARVADPRDECASGFLAGFWRSAADDAVFDGGFFRGLVLSENGRAAGFLMGRYGVNSDGERVFAGKLIGHNGHIRGLVRGKWMPASEGNGMGDFQGHWATRSGVHAGQLRGQYQSRGDGGVGYFSGQWAEDCNSPS